MIPIPGKSLLWKIGAVGASSIALTLAGALILEKQATHRAEKERDSLRAQIEHPDTGYIARLRTCRDNTARLQEDIERQNLRYERLSLQGEQRIGDAERELERLRVRASAPQTHQRMSTSSSEETVCGRFLDYDTRFLEVLEQ